MKTASQKTTTMMLMMFGLAQLYTTITTTTTMLTPAVDAFGVTTNSFTTHQQQFQQQRPSHTTSNSASTQLRMAEMEDEIAQQLAKAKAMLAKSKAKLMDDGSAVAATATDNIPQQSSSKKELVTKTQNDKGLITTDGDIMAQLSEQEVWEQRPLAVVFPDEEEEDAVSSSLADRDVAASIYGLRKSLQNDDYRKIFDTRNRFIGDE